MIICKERPLGRTVKNFLNKSRLWFERRSSLDDGSNVFLIDRVAFPGNYRLICRLMKTTTTRYISTQLTAVTLIQLMYRKKTQNTIPTRILERLLRTEFQKRYSL